MFIKRSKYIIKVHKKYKSTTNIIKHTFPGPAKNHSHRQNETSTRCYHNLHTGAVLTLSMKVGKSCFPKQQSTSLNSWIDLKNLKPNLVIAYTMRNLNLAVMRSWHESMPTPSNPSRGTNWRRMGAWRPTRWWSSASARSKILTHLLARARHLDFPPNHRPPEQQAQGEANPRARRQRWRGGRPCPSLLARREVKLLRFFFILHRVLGIYFICANL